MAKPNIGTNIDLRKKEKKMILKKIFLSWWIMPFSVSANTNSLFNLIDQQPNIDKIYLNTKDPCKAKYQFLIEKRKSTGLKHFNDSKVFK